MKTVPNRLSLAAPPPALPLIPLIAATFTQATTRSPVESTPINYSTRPHWGFVVEGSDRRSDNTVTELRTTDGWSGYSDLVKTALSRDLTVSHEVVNHSESYVDSEGRHPNSVEGMQMHLKLFLAKFSRMGRTLDEVINRVYAAAYISSPSSSDAYSTALQKSSPRLPRSCVLGP